MGKKSLGIIEERVKKREILIEKARSFSECVLRKLSNLTIIVYGSVARGDYNAWSDVDVLIVTQGSVPRNPVKRLDLIHECMKLNPLIEPIIITHEELVKLLNKKNPLVLEALQRGVVLIDELDILRQYNLCLNSQTRPES